MAVPRQPDRPWAVQGLPLAVTRAAPRIPLANTRSLSLLAHKDADKGRGERVDLDYYLYPPIAYFTLTEEGSIAEVNLAGAAMLGVPRAALVGQSLAQFVARNDEPIFDHHRRKLLNSTSYHTCVIGLINNNGTHFLARLDGTVVRQNATHSRLWRAAVTDLRVRVRREAELRTAQGVHGPAVAEAPAARLPSANRAQIIIARPSHAGKKAGTDQRMLGSGAVPLALPAEGPSFETASLLAHELMQPLTAMINYVEASRRTMEPCRGRIPDQAFDCMDKAVREASRAGQLVHRLRRLVEKGQAKKARESINETIRDVVATTFADACDKGVTVKLTLASTLPPVMIDQIQIQQVIVNLVRNAIEALADAPERVLVIETARASADFVEITVSDTGPGLCPEVAAHLFQPIGSRKAQGMGIGLSICRTIVTAHGGKIWATANPDGGTAFHFTLPVGRQPGHG